MESEQVTKRNSSLSIAERILGKKIETCIKMAEDIGRRSNGTLGAQILKALQIAFVLRATRKARFSGRMKMRLRGSVLITAVPGVGKSFVVDFFFKEICGARNPILANNHNLEAPRVIDDDGEGSWESWRGGATSRGKLIEPLILSGDFIVLTEMSSVTGEGRTLDIKRVRRLGTLVEEGRMTVTMNKLHEMDDDEFREFAEAAREVPGMHVSTRPRAYAFESDAVYVICTTPIGEKDLVQLKKAGFPGRFDCVEVELERHEEVNIIRDFGKFGQIDVSALKALNEDIWNTPVKEVPYPPAELLDDLAQKWLAEQADEISSASNTSPLDIVTLRDLGHIARLMAAHALARIFASRERGDRTPIETLEYTREDADFAKDYLTKHLNSLRITSLEHEKAVAFDAIPDTGHRAMKKTLLEQFDEGSDRSELPTTGLIETFLKECKKMELSEQTAKNYLSMFRKANLIKGGKYGDKEFTVTNSAYVTKRLGITTERHSGAFDGFGASQEDESNEE